MGTLMKRLRRKYRAKRCNKLVDVEYGRTMTDGKKNKTLVRCHAWVLQGQTKCTEGHRQ